MKLQPDKTTVQSITAHGPGWVGIQADRIEHSVVIGSRGQRLAWNCARFEDLSAEHFAQLAEQGSEVVIFGSGQTLRFPKPAWLRPLIEKRIGVETMDTAAACRTYNILAQEGRDVIVALLLEPAGRAGPTAHRATVQDRNATFSG